MTMNFRQQQNANTITSMLRAGDILLFRPNKKTTWAQRLIMFGQALIRKKHGHYDTMHAAICTGYNTYQQPMIAHITVIPKQSGAYFHEPLSTLLSRDGGDRGFIAYRSTSSKFAKEISRVAADEKCYAACKYSIISAISSVFFQSQSRQINRVVTTRTFCSRFVIEVLKKSQANLNSLAPQARIAIPDKSTPKQLESYLSQRIDFQRHCHIGQSSYHDLIHVIHNQLIRLGQKTDPASRRKYCEAKTAFNNALDTLSRNHAYSEWQKANYLVRTILPIFQRNTGLGLATPTSYNAVAGLVRKLGMFKYDLSPIAQPAVAKARMSIENNVPSI